MDKSLTINQILSYIEDNLDEEITLDKIATEFSYSKFYIARLFKEQVGSTLHKYIQNRRLTEAALQLVETDMPIIEIAYEAHYTSQQAFTKAFLQEYSYTPQVYRRTQPFYPKQKKITLLSDFHTSISKQCYVGGKMTA